MDNLLKDDYIRRSDEAFKKFQGSTRYLIHRKMVNKEFGMLRKYEGDAALYEFSELVWHEAINSMPAIPNKDAEIARLRDALTNLLKDSQHKGHEDCDSNCPILQARQALAPVKETT